MSKDVDKLVEQLVAENSLKAWSLIITFFGDAVVTRGGNVSAKTVQSVLSEAGMSAGAVRTALSRLASDQWIIRQKIGRESYYELAESGYQPFKAAALRIYSPIVSDEKKLTSAKGHSSCLLAVKNPNAKVPDASLLKQGMQITSNCWLFYDEGEKTQATLENGNFLLMNGSVDELPQWVADKLLPKEQSHGYVQLQKRFAAIKQVELLAPLESLVVRCLLVHQWRRLLLRSLALPINLVPGEWPENDCREFVAEMYHKLLPDSEAWLDEHAGCAGGSMPSASNDIKLRFTEQYTTVINNRD